MDARRAQRNMGIKAQGFVFFLSMLYSMLLEMFICLGPQAVPVDDR